MSILSKIRLSKKAAKEHKKQLAEQEAGKGEAPKAPYKHIPTHAAVDALSGAPSSWKHDDRLKIKEQHQRRSQMNISRAGSSISATSYMNAADPSGSSTSAITRNSSYNSSTWNDRIGDMLLVTEPVHKIPRSMRGHSDQDSGVSSSLGRSPLGSEVNSEDTSIIVSSGNSTTSMASSEHLDISISKPVLAYRVSYRPQAIVYEESNIFAKLHTSTTRNIGEAPLLDFPSVVAQTLSAPVLPQEPKEKATRWGRLGRKSLQQT